MCGANDIRGSTTDRNHSKLWLLLLLSLIIGYQPLFGQQNPVQTDSLNLAPGDTAWLSHGFIVPYSEILTDSLGQPIEEKGYEIDYPGGWLLIKDSSEVKKSYLLSYRYFTRHPQKEVALRKIRITADTAKTETMVDVFLDDPMQAESEAFWETSQIRKSGSLSRGLTLGNNRGLSVTSGLRLQLEGDLGDGLKIVGAITDENLPVQPDGTTQQISDFDKVFVKLMKDPLQLTIGDFEVSRKHTRFANVYRNVLGVQAGFERKGSRASVSGAVAKGKFHTNSMPGIDGVSGPYRLTGKNGERFFFVLAGSERVYLNGKLMTRGENQDYIINYNTAEVTFTARHVITNVSRIVIDFEYNDQYYNRSLLTADLQQRFLKDKVKLGFSYSRDADNANAPFGNTRAFEEAREVLGMAGDSNDQAFTSGVDSVGYLDGALRYERRDTVINGMNYERYIRSQDSSAVYLVFCSFVGQGNGFYRRVRSVAGGENVFEWIAPDENGRPRGDYAPIRKWVLPRLLEVADVQLNWQLSKHLELYNETAVSRDDKNRLSRLGDDDNTDIASRTGIRAQNLALSDSLNLSVDAYYQYVGARYTNLDRVYQAEYDRVWDLKQEEGMRIERIGMARMGLEWERKAKLEAEGGFRNTGPGKQAYRQMVSLQSYMPRFLQGNYTLTHISSEDQAVNRNSSWLRNEGDVFAPLGNWRLGSVIWMEDKKEQYGDSLGNNSFSFVDLKPYIKTVNTKKFDGEASINYRYDKAWSGGLLKDKSRAYTWYLKTQYRPSRVLNLRQITAFRQLDIIDTSFVAEGLENSRVINSNLQLTFAPKNRLLYTNLIYDISSERLAQREVRYIQVNPGQGQYVWLDSLFNRDGIQDIEEFQLANNPLIADFIRVVVPSRDLFPSTRLSFSGNMRWELKKLFPKSKHALKETLRNIRATTTVRATQNKFRNTELSSYWLNLVDPFADTSLLDANMSFRQDLSFFQNHPTGDLRFSYLNNQSKLFLSTGDEFRGFNYTQAAQRLNLSESKSIELDSRIGRKFVAAASFPTRNYDIFFWETEPRINFQFNRKFRFSTAYVYRYKRNTTTLAEINAETRIHKLVFDSKLNFSQRNNLLTRLELVNMNESGEPDFSAQYELREGLQPGLNAIWQIFTTYYLLSNVELSLTYDGRAAAKTKTIHTGRVQIRAFF